MAVCAGPGTRVDRGQEFNTCFILKKLSAECAAYRLKRVHETHLLTDVPQSNANFLITASAGRRYVMPNDIPSLVSQQLFE